MNARIHQVVECDWSKAFRLALIDPNLDTSTQHRLAAQLNGNFPFDSGVWVASSGTTRRNGSSYKFIALSRDALYASAESVNLHLNASKEDIWCTALPDIHVGGLGIHIRAALSRSLVVRGPGNNCGWNPKKFVSVLETNAVTLTSLVPTQVSDLIAKELRAPHSLRAVVVGGANLSLKQYQHGRELGWPLLPSYGLTECSSQVATAELVSLKQDCYPDFKILRHIRAEIHEGRLQIASPALLSAIAEISLEDPNLIQLSDPRVDGWFVTEDRVHLEQGMLTHLGRVGDLVKVGGEGVDTAEVIKILSDAMIDLSLLGNADANIIASPDERLGSKLILHVTSDRVAGQIRDYVNSRVSPAAQLREVIVVSEIKRNDLGKAVVYSE